MGVSDPQGPCDRGLSEPPGLGRLQNGADRLTRRFQKACGDLRGGGTPPGLRRLLTVVKADRIAERAGLRLELPLERREDVRVPAAEIRRPLETAAIEIEPLDSLEPEQVQEPLDDKEAPLRSRCREPSTPADVQKIEA